MNDFFTCEYDREAVNKKLMNSLKSEGYRDGMNDGIKQGIEQGKGLGKKDEKIEIAKKMLEENADFDFIMRCTGLTQEELDNLN